VIKKEKSIPPIAQAECPREKIPLEHGIVIIAQFRAFVKYKFGEIYK
jgi:hypothetical protein